MTDSPFCRMYWCLFSLFLNSHYTFFTRLTTTPRRFFSHPEANLPQVCRQYQAVELPPESNPACRKTMTDRRKQLSETIRDKRS